MAQATRTSRSPSASQLASGRSPSRDRLLLALLIAAAVLAFLQPTLGGVVRVTGSGDGCPDWPQCFGSWVPPWNDGHAITEWSHRTVGTLFGTVIFLATALIWLRYFRWKSLVYTYTAALILVAIVGGIGGAVVLNDLDPAIRTVHLAGAELVAALTTFGLVLATHRSAHPGSWDVMPEHRTGLKLAISAAALSLVTLLSGAYMVWRGAGAICQSWPLCGGAVIPDSELAWIHVIHRLIALTATLFILYAAHRVYRLPGASGALKVAAMAAPVIIVAQVLMGAANPWSGFDEWARAGHLSLATLMWVDLVFVVSLILLPVRRKAEEGLPTAGHSGSGVSTA